MNIHLNLHQFKLTDSIRAFAISKISRLSSFDPEVQSADVTLAHDYGAGPEEKFSATVRLALPGKDVHATDTRHDLYAAINAVRDKLARQLRKRKTRLTQMRRQKRQRRLANERSFGASPEALECA